MADYYIGTCSFTDKGLDGAFYPQGMQPSERISFYARHFNVVEIDSSYYALPSERNSVLFNERTPEGFVIHFKAFGLMTRHRVETRRLGKALSGLLPAGYHAPYVDDPPDALRQLAFEMFYRALQPLQRAGKLGHILFQYPPYFVKNAENERYILSCREWMKDYPLAVEFRHNSWTSVEELADTLRFLQKNGLTYVSVDEPQFATHSTVPPIAEATTNVAYVRFHGRNTHNWFRKGISVAERFDYLYSREELNEWVMKIERLADATDRTYLMFNNCMNTYPVQNARDLADALGTLRDKDRIALINQTQLEL